MQDNDFSQEEQQPNNPLLKTTVKYRSFPSLVFMVLNISMSSFYFGYSMQYLGTFDILTIMHVYGITFQKQFASALYNGLIPIGGGIGALSSFLLLKYFSRKNSLIVVDAIAIVFGLLLFIQNQYTLIFCRLMQGVCVGFYSAIAPIIIKQFAPTEIAGTLGTFNQLFIAFGIFFACLLQWILNSIFENEQKYWIFMFGFTLITTIIQIVGLLFIYKYETPKYLLQKGKQQQCRKVLEWIYLDQFVEEMLQQKKNDRGISNKQTSIISQYQKATPRKKNGIRLLISVHLTILQQFIGVYAVVIYATGLVKIILPRLEKVIPVILNLEQTLACLLSGYLLLKFGRKQLLQAGTIGGVISLLLIGFGFMIKDYASQETEKTLSSIFVILGLVLFMANFGLSIGPVVWLYIPQVLEPQLISLSTAANWIATALVTFLFPILQKSFGTPSYLFLFYALYSSIGFFVTQKFAIETKGKTEKQIYDQYDQKFP